MAKVKVTKQFSAVPEGAVYGKLYVEDDIVDGVVADYALRNQWGVLASEDEVAASMPSADKTEEADPPAAPVRKARVLKQCEFDVDGKPARFAKGVTVEGDLAERMVEAGVASWADEKPAPEANKNAGAAPSNK